jgi:hypothetical protein
MREGVLLVWSVLDSVSHYEQLLNFVTDERLEWCREIATTTTIKTDIARSRKRGRRLMSY